MALSDKAKKARDWLVAKGHKSSEVKATKLKWDTDADVTRSILSLHKIDEDTYRRAGGKV